MTTRTARALAALLALAALPALAPGSAAAQPAPDSADLAALEARSIGPAVMSGRIAAVEGIADSPDTLFVGAATGGVWRSVDGGATWEPIFDDQPSLSIGEIEVHPANHDLVWVGTGEDNPRNSVGVGQGIFKSVDGGESWKRVGLRDSEHIAEILVHPDDPSTAWVAASGPLWNEGGQRGVYRTTDGGESWERVLAPPNATTGAADLAMDPDNPDKIFATLWQHRRWPYFFKSGGPGSGLYVSHDGGESWERIGEDAGLPEGPLGKINVAIAPSNPEIVYALVEAENTALLRSEDGGRSWTTVNRGEGIGDRPFYYNRIQVDPSNPNRVYHIAGDLRVSEDGGETFRELASWQKGVHVDHHALWIDPSDGSYLVDGNDGGIYISRDRGGAWRFVKNLPVSQFYEISVDDATPYHVLGGLQDNGSWRGPAETWRGESIRNWQWEEVGFGDGFTTLADPNDPRYGWTTWQEGNIMRFDLETGNRRSIKPAPPSDTAELRFNWNAPIALDPQDPDALYFGSQYVHYSTDDGNSWERISPDLTTDSTAWQQQEESGGLTYDVTGAENYTTVYTIAPSPVRDGVVWAGTDDGNVHVTRDGGANWTNVEGDMPGKPRHAWVSHIEASKHDAGTAYAAVHDYMRGDWTTYVYRTTDFGESWERLPTEGVDGFARTVEEDPVVRDLLWLGTEFGLFYSLDGGRSWREWSHGFPSGVPVRAITTQPREHDLVVGTYGRGIYVIDDLRPLRAVAREPSVLRADLRLFAPDRVIQHVQGPRKTYQAPGNTVFEGENEPYGALLTVAATVPDSLAEEEHDGDVRGDAGAGAAGRDTARYPYTEVESAPDTADPEPTLEAVLQVVRADSVMWRDSVELSEGMNRFAWDLETGNYRSDLRSMEELREDLAKPEAVELERDAGPLALPAEYGVRVVAGADTASGSVRVVDDGRLDVTAEGRRAKRELMIRVHRLQETGIEAVEALRKARVRIERALDLMADQEGLANADSLRARAKSVIDSLKAAEEEWVGPLEEKQGITDFESVRGDLGWLGFQVSERHAPTPEERQRVEVAAAEAADALERTNRVLSGPVAGLREALSAAGIEVLPATSTVEMRGGGG